VKVNGQDQYFDPGAAFTPYGLVPWMETGVVGLRLDRDGGTWIQTPLPMSEQTRIERTAQLKLSSEGDLSGKLKVTFTGLAALAWRIEERNEDDASRRKGLEDEVRAFIPSGSEAQLANSPDWQNGNGALVAEFALKVPGWASSAGRRALFPAGLFSASEKHLFEHADRVWPVYFRYPFQKVDDFTVELPQGWKIESVPKIVDQDAKAIQYSLKVEDSGGVLHVRRVLRSDVVMVDKDHYPVLRNFYQLVKTQDEQQAILQPAGMAAAN